MRLTHLIVIMVASSLVAACGGVQIDKKTSLKRELDSMQASARTSLQQLSDGLKAGTVTNAIVLRSYAKAALSKQPQYRDIIEVLASEGTDNGPTYKALRRRLEGAENKILSSLDTQEVAQSLADEFNNISTSAQNYDAMLVDAINVLADFTEGELPKMRELEYADQAASTAPVGSEYIGNTNYGEWKQGPTGTSFWAFYGQYAMFSQLFGRNSMSYGGWNTNRRPSYYHDYGRDAYSSPAGRANQSQADTRTKKQYTAQGKPFKSSYARSAPTIKGATPGTKPAFKSSYARSGTSSFKSSSYNSRSSTSGRSSSRGGK
jgi:hypothetical protein